MIPSPLSRYALGSAGRTAHEQTRPACRLPADLLAFCLIRFLAVHHHITFDRAIGVAEVGQKRPRIVCVLRCDAQPG